MNLTKLSKNELLVKCEALGVTKCKSKNKMDLIEIITNKLQPNSIELIIDDTLLSKNTIDEDDIIYDNKLVKNNHNKITIPKPILKWVGGKTQILDKLIVEFPTNINNYREIFLGGGSVLLTLLSYVRNGIIKIHGNINYGKQR